jgi:hypothetical protein
LARRSLARRAVLFGAVALHALGWVPDGRAAPPGAPRFAEEKSATVLPAAPAASLPDSAGAWVRSPSPRSYDSVTIFDYMNGAAEIYVGYRFRTLDVYEYAAPAEEKVLVELYWLESSDDAFGLLSLDWNGEAVDLRDDSCPEKTGREGDPADRVFPARALYENGYLRVWSDDLYARVIASRETAASREAMFGIARSLVLGRRESEPPDLVRSLPPVAESGARLRPDEVRYVRSHLVLNSTHYLADENVLNLGPATGCVLGVYDSESQAADGGECRLLVAQYPTMQAAAAARESLRRTLFASAPNLAESSSVEMPDAVSLEGGWAACVQLGKCAALAFECRDRETAASLVRSVRL